MLIERTMSRSLDEKLFKKCNFIEAFLMVNLRNFVFEVPQEIFPSLVRLFYFNRKYSNGFLSSEVKKHPIQISLEEYTQVYNLSYNNQVYDKKVMTLIFILLLSYFLLMKPLSFWIYSTLLETPNIILIHYIVSHVILLIKRNSNHINKSDIPSVWFGKNIVEKNWVAAVIHHMMDNKKKNTHLPYSKLNMKILEYPDYNMKEEKLEIRH